MGCKFSKTNKVLPVVEPTYVKPATLPPTSQPAKKGLGKRRLGKKNPPVTRDTPQAANDDASPAVDASHPSPGAESTQETNSFNIHPLTERQQSVDYVPIRLVKEADVCNREVTPFNIRETPETLMIKRCSHGSFKTDPLICAGSSDSGIALVTGENNEYAKVITEKSSPEKQEIAKVCATTSLYVYVTVFVNRFLIHLLLILPFKGCTFGHHIGQVKLVNLVQLLPNVHYLPVLICATYKCSPTFHYNKWRMTNMTR